MTKGYILEFYEYVDSDLACELYLGYRKTYELGEYTIEDFNEFLCFEDNSENKEKALREVIAEIEMLQRLSKCG